MNRLRFARLQRRWSQATLASLTGIQQTYISQFELGNVLPGPAQRQRLANVLGVPADRLLDQVPDDILTAEPAER